MKSAVQFFHDHIDEVWSQLLSSTMTMSIRYEVSCSVLSWSHRWGMKPGVQFYHVHVNEVWSRLFSSIMIMSMRHKVSFSVLSWSCQWGSTFAEPYATNWDLIPRLVQKMEGVLHNALPRKRTLFPSLLQNTFPRSWFARDALQLGRQHLLYLLT